MLLTVKKQIEETVEIKSPAYYKDSIGNIHFINDAGQLTTVRKKMINIWEPADGKPYNEAIEELWIWGTPITKAEFDNAYADTMAKINIAAGAVEF